MIRIIITLLTIFLTANWISGQINRNGIPFIRNFDPVEYNAAEQNWSVVQDKRGVIYIGNNDRGVLEFDGQNWRSIPVPNNSAVRSLAINDDGAVFAGAIAELGYLAPDETGMMTFNSLLHLIDSAHLDFSDVWKTYTLDDKVFFSTRNRLYIYENGMFRILQHKPESAPFFSFLVDRDLYWGTFNSGLMRMDGDSFTVVENGDFFIQRDILSILPYDHEYLVIGTAADGVFLYNRENGEIADDLFTSDARDYLKNNILYHGTVLPGGYYAYATLYGGVVIINPEGGISQLITSENGLRDEMISSVYNNHEHGMEMPLWLTMNNGIALVEISNPIKSFGEESGLRGLVLDVARFHGRLFVATTTGVFYLGFRDDNHPVFRQAETIRNAAWSFAVTDIPGLGERMVVGTQGAIYEIDTNFQINSITGVFEGKTHNCFSLHASVHHPGRIYLGLSDDLEYIEFADNMWEYTSLGAHDEIRSIKEDSEGNLWLGTYINGLIRVDFTREDTSLVHYRVENGLPEGLKNIQVHKYGEDLIFATEKGIYNFDESSGSFYPDPEFENIHEIPGTGIYQFIEDETGMIWISAYNENERWIETLVPDDNNSFRTDEVPFKPLPSIWCDVIYEDGSGITWLGISNRLFSFDKKVTRNYQQPFHSVIRKVTISQIDSVLFHGTNYRISDAGKLPVTLIQPDNLKPRLKFTDNRLEFEFASPFFESADKTEFSWFLEGEDRTWSGWSKETRAQYTYLREGNYTFRVKSRNVYGAESSEATYEFYIAPPWHRTVIAYIGYLMLLSIFIWAIVLFNSRRLKKEKIILEGIVRERTSEILKQKEEIEEQRDRIAGQNKNLTDSIEYARRIQAAILPPGDYIKEPLPNRFTLFLPRDIVSGDFYWLTRMNNKIISVAADCRGHGVPGGFMSMLGITFLNEIVSKSSDKVTAGDILNQLRDQIIRFLHQTGKTGESQDGTDISLFILDLENKKLEFAGANNPLIIIRDPEIIEIKGDKMPIGIHDRADVPFTNHVVELKDNDVIYTLSDGYQDQSGGPEGNKFMIKRLKALLLEIHTKPMPEQKEILEKELLEWQGSFGRVDDIIIMGVKV